MTLPAQLTADLEAIAAIARFAPSVHNTQPWLLSAEDDNLVITVNPKHVLSDGDPTGRETAISIGIFTEAVAIAAASRGLVVSSVTYEKSVARVHCQPAHTKHTEHDELITALRHRSTDRSVYKPASITDNDLIAIRQSYADPHVTIHASTDSKLITTVANLTSKAIGVALSSPSFRHELAHYLVQPQSSKRRGIAVKSLYIPAAIAFLQPTMLRRGLSLNRESALEKKRWQSASGLVIITADGDMPKYWFKVGRAYLRASLTIEQMGYSQATSAAIVEASNYHEDVEELLGTSQRILAVMRIGRGHKIRHHSPRVDVDEILA